MYNLILTCISQLTNLLIVLPVLRGLDRNPYKISTYKKVQQIFFWNLIFLSYEKALKLFFTAPFTYRIFIVSCKLSYLFRSHHIGIFLFL